MRIRTALWSIVSAIVVSVGIAPVAQAAPGDLDPTFGTGGKVVTNFTNREDVGYPMAIQPDGKIVVAGTAGNAKFALARYTSDGSLDASFGGNGKLTTDLTKYDDFAWNLALQSDGKIVAVGDAGAGGPNGTFAVVRYNTDGSLDS